MKVTFGLAERHKEALSRVATTGQVIPGDWPLMRDLAGAVNQAWDSAAVPPVPPPDPADPLARMRLAPGQLAMWANATSVEIDAMRAIHGQNRVSQQVGFYGPGMPGNVGVRQTGAATYEFVNASQQWEPDVNGAGDALVAKYAATSGIPVIRALSP